MKKRTLVLICLASLIWLDSAAGQPLYNSKTQVGVVGGVFRISIEHFNEYYGSRYAFPVGGYVSYGLTPSFHIAVRGKLFQKSNTRSGEKMQWRESWIGLGIQQFSRSMLERSKSYLGFGLAFFHVEERDQGKFLARFGHTDRSLNPVGFYLVLGFLHPLKGRLTSNFEIELTSAGIGRDSSFEVHSIGGIFVGVGISGLLF